MADFKPEKVWRVGDKIYPDYIEAIKATTAHRQCALRNEITDIIVAEFPTSEDASTMAFAEAASDELFHRFTIARKRAK